MRVRILTIFLVAISGCMIPVPAISSEADNVEKAARIFCAPEHDARCLAWARWRFETGTHPMGGTASEYLRMYREGEECFERGFDFFNEETGACGRFGDEHVPPLPLLEGEASA